MGKALATAAIKQGHEVVIVSGPVNLSYPAEASVIDVLTTEEMLSAARKAFQRCDGVIGVAAPCDYRPRRISASKLAKTGAPLTLELIETDDVIATLGAEKGTRWAVGFALETDDHRFRAITKAERKNCDLMVLNSPAAMDSLETEVELIRPDGAVLAHLTGSKESVASELFDRIQNELIRLPRA